MGLLRGGEAHGAPAQCAAGQRQSHEAGLGGSAGVLLDGHVAKEAPAVEVRTSSPSIRGANSSTSTSAVGVTRRKASTYPDAKQSADCGLR